MILCPLKKTPYLSPQEHPKVNKNLTYIKYASFINNSITLIFDVRYMSSLDLYPILMSFLKNEELPVSFVSTMFVKYDSPKLIFLSNLRASEIRNKNYYSFNEWWECKKLYEGDFIGQKDIYGITLIFNSSVFCSFLKKYNISVEEFVASYRPLTPWDENVISFMEEFFEIS